MRKVLAAAGTIPWTLDFGSCKGVGPAIAEPLRRHLGITGSFAEALDYDVWIVLDPDRVHHDALPHFDDGVKKRIAASALQASIPLSRKPGFDYLAYYPRPAEQGSFDSANINAAFDSSFDGFGLYYYAWPGNPEYQSFLSPLEHVTDDRLMRDFPMPVIQPVDLEMFKADIAYIKGRRKMSAAWSGSLYELSWYLRGRERLFLDYYDDPRSVDALVEKIADFVEALTRKNLECGVDILCYYDDLGTQNSTIISPEIFRRFYKPHYKRIWSLVKPENRHIFLHSCGNVASILPDLIECGLDILNPVQPEAMDVQRTFRDYGRDLAFWGTVGVQQTFCRGTRSDIFDIVRERVDSVGARGVLILGPANTLGKDVPLENVSSFLEACRKYC
jgi:uroporphyrinogen decarboxylase